MENPFESPREDARGRDKEGWGCWWLMPVAMGVPFGLLVDTFYEESMLRPELVFGLCFAVLLALVARMLWRR